MKFEQVVCVIAVVACFLGWTSAARAEDEPFHAAITGRETLTDDWFGLGRELEDLGISLELELTQVYQVNLRGGLSTHRRSGRYSGLYELELEVDTEKLFGLPGGTIAAEAEGGWSEGIDPPSVGSVFGVNYVADERCMPIILSQLWYQQSLLEGSLRVRLGKQDPTSWFDGNEYAGDETSQFLNSALVNNPTVPFPDEGLGIAAHLRPISWWYVAAGVFDAHAVDSQTGFNTAFHGPCDFFMIAETGISADVPLGEADLPGAYRVGLWYDPQSKDRLDGRGSKRDDVGFYFSADQVIWSSGDDEDHRNVGLFARFGLADGDVNEVKSFWSVGTACRGLIPTRADDVLGFGVAQGRLSGRAGFTTSHETAMELYYNASVTPWLSVSPSMQYVFNPGGDRDVSDAVVAGVRVHLSF